MAFVHSWWGNRVRPWYRIQVKSSVLIILISFFHPFFERDIQKRAFKFVSISVHAPNHAVQPRWQLVWCTLDPVDPTQWYSVTHPTCLNGERSCISGEILGRQYVGTQSPFSSYFSFQF
jgi:hypothetical protein